MLNRFRRKRAGLLGHKDVAKYRIDILNDDTRLAFSVPYQAEPTERRFVAAEISQMTDENVMEPVTTEWEARIVFAPVKAGSRYFYEQYQRLNRINISDSYPYPVIDEYIDS